MTELPDESIDHILTSPPYFGHRFFLPSNGTVSELGQEETARAYIDNLLPVLKECRRVMRPSGSILLNMADSYSKANKMQIPERVSIEIQDRLGLILRNTLIWWKNTSRPPESSKRRRHTDFEYVYHFVKDAAQYYFDADAIRIPYVTPERTDHRPPRHHNNGNEVTLSNLDVSLRHAGGRIPGCVLEISRHVPSPAETNSPIRHTAAMNPQLARELLKPIAQVGDVICDPFSGSATTGAVALEYGCFYVGYDINPVFNRIGAKRLKQRISEREQA